MILSCNKPSCYFLLPMRENDLNFRIKSIYRTLICFKHAMYEALPVIGNFKIHIHINQANDVKINRVLYNNNIFTFLKPFPYFITISGELGKIPSINFGLMLTRHDKYNLFFCVDNDIIFDSFVIRKMIETQTREKREATVCMKMPLINKESTCFQKTHAYFFQCLFEEGIGPKRPTGSLYCVDPYRIDSFPLICNEADYLMSKNISRTDIVIFSEQAKSFEKEVSRRIRLYESAKSIGFLRFNDDPDFIKRLLKKAEFKSGILKSDRFVTSANLYFKIISEISAVGI